MPAQLLDMTDCELFELGANFAHNEAMEQTERCIAGGLTA
jgi:hypothetical protein